MDGQSITAKTTNNKIIRNEKYYCEVSKDVL